MLGTVFVVAMAVVGIDVGWEPDAQGNVRYIIQIEPELARQYTETSEAKKFLQED